jgi:hypothetical protein
MHLRYQVQQIGLRNGQFRASGAGPHAKPSDARCHLLSNVLSHKLDSVIHLAIVYSCKGLYCAAVIDFIHFLEHQNLILEHQNLRSR